MPARRARSTRARGMTDPFSVAVLGGGNIAFLPSYRRWSPSFKSDVGALAKARGFAASFGAPSDPPAPLHDTPNLTHPRTPAGPDPISLPPPPPPLRSHQSP